MKSKGQVWVETVLYTLIGLALIAIVLSIATPKINESRDRLIVDQSIESLNSFDERIIDVLDKGEGNVRIISAFNMKRGELIVNGTEDKITFLIKGLAEAYSEPDVEIEFGKVTVVSRENSGETSVELVLDYYGIINITYDGQDAVMGFASTSTPYSFSIENKGLVGPLNVVDIKEISRG